MITKADIITEIAQACGFSRGMAELAFNALVNCVGGAVRDGEAVKLQNIGTFNVVDKRERRMLNPQTGEMMTVPAGRRIRFVPSGVLKAAVNRE